MDTRRLRYFLQIVDSGSVSRAAKVLGLAQPAVSQQIAVLEHELKVRLLNRSAKGVTPTLAGYRLYDRARRIVRQVEGLRFELMDDVLSGTVTIGLAPSISLLFGLPLLQALRQHHPLIMPQIIENPGQVLRDQLERGLLDLAVLPTTLAEGSVTSFELFRERFDLFSAAKREIVSDDPRALAALPWIVTRSPNSIRNMLEAWFAQQGLELNVVAEVDSLPLLIKAVESDLGVTLSSPTAVRSVGGAIDSLVSTPLPQSSPIRVFSACWRASRSAPTIMRTAEILKDIAAGLQLPKVEP